MNFYFSAVGSRREVLSQLKNADTRGKKLAEVIRDAIVDELTNETEDNQQGFEDRYNITVNGHSADPVVPLTISVVVQSRYVPKADQA
jgi:hypothetical protein